MRSEFKVLGTTPEKNYVVSGVFKLFDTNGLALDILFMNLQSMRMIPDWTCFIDDAVESGWKRKTILSRLEPAIKDSYGSKFWDGMSFNLQCYLNYKFGTPE